MSPKSICVGDERGVPLLDGARLGSRLWFALLCPRADDLSDDARGDCSLSSSVREFQLGLRSMGAIFEGCSWTTGETRRLSSLARPFLVPLSGAVELSIIGNTDVEARPVGCVPTPLAVPLGFFCPIFPMFVKTPDIAFPPPATPLGALVRTSNIPFPIFSKAAGVGQPSPGKPDF